MQQPLHRVVGRVRAEVEEVIRQQHVAAVQVVMLVDLILLVAVGVGARSKLAGCGRIVAGVDRVAMPSRISRGETRSTWTLLGMLLEVGLEVEDVGHLHRVHD